MPRTVVLVLALVAALWAEDPAARAQYVGGTLSAIAGQADVRIHTSNDEFLCLNTKSGEYRIPYHSVNLLEYGQNVNRRYAMAILISPVLLLSKARKHFLTIGYSDGEGRQQALVFRVDKKHVRSVLASLEARTGRKVEFQDDEARKAGKG
jgi:hypothetical protein